MSQLITLLGATGSIGDSTLSLITQHPSKFKVFALTANTSVDKMLNLCLLHKPRYAVMACPTAALSLKSKLLETDLDLTVLSGSPGLEMVSAHDEVDIVMAGVVGAAGLLPTMAAARAGKKILLANKESLVVAGHLFMDSVRKHNAVLLPVDSEHNALFQCMPAGYRIGQAPEGVKKLHLTASGGPFRNHSQEQLAQVTPKEACTHPNWTMGAKISVDSATLMNKGLEVIEAHWLFNLPLEKIDVLVHPESVIHSLVEYQDGSFLAQLGAPDMRIPIAHALAWPERITTNTSPLNLLEIGQLNFQAPDTVRFPCLRLALQALSSGQEATIALNAANEIAVEAFLNQSLAFADISHVIEEVISVTQGDVHAIEGILALDNQARNIARKQVERLCLLY